MDEVVVCTAVVETEVTGSGFDIGAVVNGVVVTGEVIAWAIVVTGGVATIASGDGVISSPKIPRANRNGRIRRVINFFRTFTKFPLIFDGNIVPYCIDKNKI